MIAPIVRGPRWLDVQRRWPWWSAAQEHEAAVAVLGTAVHNVERGTDLLADMLEADSLHPRAARPIWRFRHEQAWLARELMARSARDAAGGGGGAFRSAASAIDRLAGLIEQIADLHIVCGGARASKESRTLAHALVDMSQLVADGWERYRVGRPFDLQLRGLQRAHRRAWRLCAEARAIQTHGGAGTKTLAEREIVAWQARAVGLMNGAILIVLAVPRSVRGVVLAGRIGLAATVPAAGAATGARRAMPSPRFRSKDGELLALFRRAATNLRRTGELIDRLLMAWPESPELRDEILECEHVGDRVTHDLIHHLHTTPARTFDREDVFRLAACVDDVVDFAEEVADYLGLYQIEAPMDAAQQLAGVLRESCSTLAAALDGLDDPGALRPLLIEIHRLENEGDRIVRAAISSLFVGGIDPMVVIRWKDLFERLEDAIDSCEQAAHILEGIAVRRV